MYVSTMSAVQYVNQASRSARGSTPEYKLQATLWTTILNRAPIAVSSSRYISSEAPGRRESELAIDLETWPPDGLLKAVNLQNNRDAYERFQLLPVGIITQLPSWAPLTQHFVLRSVHFDKYLQLEVVVLEGHEPRGTFYPHGFGRSHIVQTEEEASKFTIMTPLDETTFFVKALKLVNAPEDTPHIYLRLNGEETTQFKPLGSGEVNGQTYVGPYEHILIDHFQ